MTNEDNLAVIVKTGIEQLFAPFHDLLDKLLGPAATEVGEGIADSVKVWRRKRQLRLLQEVKRMLDDTSREIKPIATRLFFSVLEAASVEDDDEMQTRWASLLANEASVIGSVHPSFIEILKQLAPVDARLLDKIYDWCESRNTRTFEWWIIRTGDGQQREQEQEALQNLARLGLVDSDYDIVPTNQQLRLVGGHAQVFSTPKLKEQMGLSDVAVRFVRACRAPKPKSGDQTPECEMVTERGQAVNP